MADNEGLSRGTEQKYEGYRVYDNSGERIGKVDEVFVDENDREEYVGVKMGFFGRRSTLIPMDLVRVNERDRAVGVAESKSGLEDAPSFDDDEDVTPEYEERIRRHFGLGSREVQGDAGSSKAAGTARRGGLGDTPLGEAGEGAARRSRIRRRVVREEEETIEEEERERPNG